MNLDELIEFLEKRPQEMKVPLGFHNPQSYRGYYDQLAFEPKENTTVGEMLACAKDALGSTYYGYKGGEYTMYGYVNCHLAKYSELGEEIGQKLLKYMMGELPFKENYCRTCGALIDDEKNK